MKPIVVQKRTEISGGLWTPKLGGDFVEGGDALSNKHYVQGRADVKELRGSLRIFFKNVTIIQRPIILTDEVKESLTKQYRDQKKTENKSKLAILTAVANEDNDEPDETDEEKERRLTRERVDLDIIFKEEVKKKIPLPRLFVYLTKKKPRSRMSDIHKTGSRVHIIGSQDGMFGLEGSSLGDFYASLKDVPDALIYQGLVVLKVPIDEPRTEDPVVYGYIRFQSSKGLKIRTASALHLQEISDVLSRVMFFVDPSKPRKVMDNVRSVSHYRSITTKIWGMFGKDLDEEVDFKTIVKMIDQGADIFLVEPQARRIFNAVEKTGDRTLSTFEFENFLIAFDILGYPPADINVLDIFDSFKTSPRAIAEEQGASKKSSDVVIAGDSKEASKEAIKEPSAGRTKLADFASSSSTAIVAKNNNNKTPLSQKPTKIEGLDFSGFCEALLTLGCKDLSDDALTKAFCYGGGITASHIEGKFLNVTEFKKAWLQVADVEEELKKRNLKAEGGLMGMVRNRDRVNRIIQEQVDAYMQQLSTIADLAETFKKDRREKKDQRKREFEEFKSKLELDAAKFAAIRQQDKRLKAKMELEEKAKKNLEEKVLRAKLLQRQMESKDARLKEIHDQVEKTEKLRQDEIRERGLDRMDLSVKELRKIPVELYHNEEAQRNLSYLVYIDLSKNKIEALPAKNFLYWMNEVRLMKLSQNHLRHLPDELETMVNLQILEVDVNRIKSLPQRIGNLKILQRLNISNCYIEDLPQSIGMCSSLKYFNAHSNQISLLPVSLGACYHMEYMDFSHNKLTELPDDIEHMHQLVHLDLNGNRIGHLPDGIGHCTSLKFLDISCNILAFLPETFSDLISLEYCNLGNNDLIISSNKFNNLAKLKTLLMQHNQSHLLFDDIGGCKALQQLDVSSNRIQLLPLEIGRLISCEDMKLDRNALTTLPPELGACRNLLKLSLTRNNIEGCLPETIALIKSLRELDLSFNKISEIPRSVIGLQEIRSIKLERCLLTFLPDTMTYLTTLELLDISYNKFKRFPIELKDMLSLKVLNISGNELSLLPRNINTMTKLDTLDLSKNILRALPVEFTDVFESVGSVDLHNNPWSDLPSKWSKLWPGKHAIESMTGYALSDAVDFLYNMRSIYATCEKLWEEFGVYHYTNRLGLKEFEDEVKKRLLHSWHEGLIEFVKTIYFLSKTSGIFPRWYSLDDNIVQENFDRKQADEIRRDMNVLRSKQEFNFRQSRTQAAYDINVVRRAKSIEHLNEEQRLNNVIIDRVAMDALRECLVQREAAAEKRRIRKERNWAKIVCDETKRMNDLLESDKDSRHEAWRQPNSKKATGGNIRLEKL